MRNIALGTWSLIAVFIGVQQISPLHAQGVTWGSPTAANNFDTTAFGDATTASGWGATAFGQFGVASGRVATAFGGGTLASGDGATAFGMGPTASGFASTAFGNWNVIASGYSSTAFGVFTGATADYSTAFGYSTSAMGSASTSFGSGAIAVGPSSLATGCATIASGTGSSTYGVGSAASGNFSTAFGWWTLANAMGSFSVGTANWGGGDPTNWVPTDPIFEVGNGHNDNRSDALIVYKNGNTNVYGILTGYDPANSAHAIVVDPTSSQITINGQKVLTNGYGLSINTYGKVGIGTTNPGANLDIVANANRGYDTELDVGTSSVHAVSYSPTYSGLLLGYNVDGNGSAQFNTSFPSWALDLGGRNPEGFASDVDSLTVRRFGAGSNYGASAPLFSIKNNGNVGIGTSTPQARLDVNGDAYIRGSVIVTGTLVNGTVVSTGSNSFLVPQQGDLAMGPFTVGPIPQ